MAPFKRHAFGSGPLGGDPVHRRGSGRDLPTGVDQPRRGGHHVPGHDGDQGVGDGNVSEAVDPGRLEVEPQHLSGQPIRHGASMPRRCDTHVEIWGRHPVDSTKPPEPRRHTPLRAGHRTTKPPRSSDAKSQVEGRRERVLIPNAGERTLDVRSRVGLYCPVSGAPKGEFVGGQWGRASRDRSSLHRATGVTLSLNSI